MTAATTATFRKMSQENRTFKTRRKWTLVLVILVIKILSVGSQDPENATTQKSPISKPTISVIEVTTSPFDNYVESLDTVSSPVFPEAVDHLNATPIAMAGRQKELQLNVSWTLSKGKELPKDYSIEVIPDSINGCISRLCYEFNIPSNQSWALVPKLHSSVQGTECKIKPGCSYNVMLIAHHRNSREVSVVEILLPECVGNICSCTKGSVLPRPNVTVESGDGLVNISWSLPTFVPEDVNISHYMLSFAEQKVSVSHKPWFVHDQVMHIPWKDPGLQWKQLKSEILAGRKYLARVQLVDSKGCSGPIGNFILEYPVVETSRDHTFPIHLYWVIGTSLFLGCSIIFFVVMKICKPQCRLKTVLASRIVGIRGSNPSIIRRQPAWPSFYRGDDESQVTETTTTTVQRFFEERSPLYVEKEIEEARLKGEADQWEICPSRIKLGRQLGEGAFGRVYIAKTDINGYPIVAVKKLKNRASSEEVSEFLGEIAMLKVVGCHPNVVALVGCCTLKQPYSALLQFAPRGDLLKHLRNLRTAWRAKRIASRTRKPQSSSSYVQAPALETRPSFTETEYTTLDSEANESLKMISECSVSSLASDAFLESLPMDPISCHSDTGVSVGLVLDSSTLHGYALQIARGMEHLESKGITHRDLAARNVLMDEDGTLKVSDLGLSRAGNYVHTKHRKVPLRWLALEAIKESRYSNKSDVWAYAVLLWEIGTLGGFPYPNLGDHQILSFLCDDKRLDRPEIVSHDLYSTMIKCWAEDPGLRPSFAELVKILDRDDSLNKAYVDINTLRSSYIFPPTEESIKYNFKFDKIDEVSLKNENHLEMKRLQNVV